MKKYSIYKDSGVDQFGEVPEHWSIIPLKFVFIKGRDSIKTGPFGSQLKSTDFVEEGFKVYNQRTVYDEDFSQNELYIDVEKFNHLKGFEVFPEEILITSRGTIGKCTIVPQGIERGVLHPCLIRIRVDQNLLANIYLWYYINQSPLFIETVKLESNATTIEVIYSDTLKNLLFPLPPLHEQQAIVTYLDEKTTLVDELIRKKQQKIQLLKEKRTALINHVVTKGLDPEVEMKDSEVEWIGEVPKHWKIKKTTYLFDNIGSGTTPNSSNESYYNGDINWLQTGDLTDGIITETSKKVTQDAISNFSTLKIYPKRSLVIAMYGATIGKLGLLEIEACTNQACCVLSSPKLIRIEFAYYWFMGAKQSIITMGYGGGQPNISQDTIRSLRLPTPPIHEQQQIVTYLDEQTQLIDTTIQQEEQKIELLKEYRQSLISNVVTGKICVLNE